MISSTDIRKHYESTWNQPARTIEFHKGPIHELPASFSILRFDPSEKRKMYAYATCGMSLGKNSQPLELHIFSPSQADEPHALMLTSIAHFHVTATSLGIGHTVNFGMPWCKGSLCSYGLITRPYLDGPKLEWLDNGKSKVQFLWLIPITEAEREYKKTYGMEALENALEKASFNYLSPMRRSVV